MTILEAVIKTLENLNGKAVYSEIYAEYEKVIGYPITNNQKAGIRACIEKNSSDSKVFNKKMIFFILYMAKVKVVGACAVCVNKIVKKSIKS